VRDVPPPGTILHAQEHQGREDEQCASHADLDASGYPETVFPRFEPRADGLWIISARVSPSTGTFR
jgi:hypothetical protein